VVVIDAVVLWEMCSAAWARGRLHKSASLDLEEHVELRIRMQLLMQSVKATKRSVFGYHRNDRTPYPMPSFLRARTPSAHAIIILIARPTLRSSLGSQCHRLIPSDNLIRPASSPGADTLRRRDVGGIRRSHKASGLGHRRRGADCRLGDLIRLGAVDLARLSV